MVGYAQSLGNCFDKLSVAGAEALLNKSREAAKKVNAAFNSRLFKRFCKLNGVSVITRRKNHGGRGDGNPLVYNGDSELLFNLLSR